MNIYQGSALAVLFVAVIIGLGWLAKKAFFVAISALTGGELEEE